MKIKKNDIVKVVSGESQVSGKVLKVFPKSEKIIIEGANFIKRHTKARQKPQQGGIVEKEAPIHVSNVLLVCPTCNRPTRIGNKILEDGKKARICKKCNEIIA